MDHHNARSRRRGRNSIGTALLRSALALLGAALASKAFATEDIFRAPIGSSSLEVPAGATLVTAGCPIYTQQANIAGSVSDPGDIVLVPTAPPCPADINLDGRVDAADILVVLAFWNNPTGYPRADVNQDGLTDAADLTAVLLAWGVCG